MTEGSGKELMWEFQTTGSAESGRRLFAMYRKPLLRFLIALCGSESEADDLSQRVWLKIIEVAKRGGVSVETVRYYEREGILAPPARRGCTADTTGTCGQPLPVHRLRGHRARDTRGAGPTQPDRPALL